jgi:His/Glu/Gln/Arg/opine family amino acid ABC transporter permease subunit
VSQAAALAHLAAERRALRRKEWLWRLGVAGALALAAFALRDQRWSVVAGAAPYLLMALARSWMLAIASLGLGALIAVPLAAGRVFGPAGIRHLCVAFIEIVRATPELMVIFWIYFAYPAMTGEALSPWSAAIVALSVIAGVYLAEVIRGGLYSVPKVQWEAGIASGLTGLQTFRYIILPQGVHSMIPAFIAQLVSSFKTTSLAYLIGVIEFFRAIILMNNTLFAPYAFYVTMACGYFACCYALSWVIRRIDPGYALVE